jgi:hypothetical protein
MIRYRSPPQSMLPRWVARVSRVGPHVYVLAVGDRDIADVRGDREDILMQITHRSSIPVLPVAGVEGQPYGTEVSAIDSASAMPASQMAPPR